MDENTSSNSVSKSQFKRSVCLAEWWLMKAQNDGVGVAVAGLTSREQQAMRFFSSAPIMKSHDLFTLETTDGLCILLKGFINKARTTENGFPDEVFSHFIFGFPPYWKELIEKCLGGDSHVNSYQSKMESQDKQQAISMSNFNKSESSPAMNLVSDFSSDGPVSTVIDRTTLDSSVSCLSEKVRNSVDEEKSVSDSYNFDSGTVLSACSLYNENNSAKVSSNLRNVKLDKKLSNSSKFDKIKSSQDMVMSETKGGLPFDENDQIQGKKSRRYNARSMSILSAGSEKLELSSVNNESCGKYSLICQETILEEPIDTLNLNRFDASFAEEKGKEISNVLNPDKNHKSCGGIKKIKSSVTRSQTSLRDADKAQSVSVDSFNLSKLDAASEKEMGEEISDDLNQDKSHKARGNIKKIRSFVTRSQIKFLDGDKEHRVAVDTLDPSKLDTDLSEEKGTEISEALNQDQNHKIRGDIKKLKHSATRSRNKQHVVDNKEHKVTTDTCDSKQLVANFAEEKNNEIVEAQNQDKIHRTCREIKKKNSVTSSQNRSHDADSNEQTVLNTTIVSESDEISNCKSGRKSYGRKSSSNRKSVSEKGASLVTPFRRKKISHSSPESFSLNRSRSGRLLMPTLKFWSNERAIYDVDGTITGIQSEDAENSVKGAKSSPQRKRMRLP